MLHDQNYRLYYSWYYSNIQKQISKRKKTICGFSRKYEFSPTLSGDEKRIGKWSEVPSLSTAAFHPDLLFVIAKSIIESDLLEVGINVLIVKYPFISSQSFSWFSLLLFLVQFHWICLALKSPKIIKYWSICFSKSWKGVVFQGEVHSSYYSCIICGLNFKN